MYKLNLNKTKMCLLVKQFDSSVPCLKDCVYSHYRGCYWLRYYIHGCIPIRATVLVSLGVVLLRILNLNDNSEEVYEVPVPFLCDMNMLKSA